MFGLLEKRVNLPLPPIYRDCRRLLVHTEELVRRCNGLAPLSPCGRGAGGEGAPHPQRLHQLQHVELSFAAGFPAGHGFPLSPTPLPQGERGFTWQGNVFFLNLLDA
ncbi:hypothetical protein VITFI_CDS1804 [Vitreoscilla filiformis]|uniref:Uncharacterized protein n=1 Tax=Vitreoscilla filiformis TaxID=63 RepID=A0A221KEV7_VITFI|nr:hypothetical protein VITFI_CDS1804 [Vitreoscilla filiformis]